MAHVDNQKNKPRNLIIGVRVNEEQKALVVQAAGREGLQVSSFIIMLLVRLRILPDTCLKKLKRRPVPYFNALHGLLGIVNKIGGNCKQLAAALPDMAELHVTHALIIAAASVITDAFQGKKIPEGVNLYRLQGDITQKGYAFNQIVKSVNAGQPSVAGLPAVLHAISGSAAAIAAALTGELMHSPDNGNDLMEKAMQEMRTNMKMAAAELTKPKKGGS